MYDVVTKKRQVIRAKLMRRATALQFLFSGCVGLGLIFIHFVATHSWNMRRSHKLQQKTLKLLWWWHQQKACHCCLLW